METFDPVAYINEPRWRDSNYGLERIADLLERMGRPQDKLRFVHVAGTNGKGSICAYTAQIMQEAGYKTGLFTSPYIMQFEERIRVNGENIPPEDLLDVTLFVREHAEAIERDTGVHPTEFELMAAVAFEYFARSGCDIVVCEVGLGGKLDATNVIDAPDVCVICRIGLDHTELLGDTMAAIAGEKAGIIKPGATVVSWPQDDAGAMAAIQAAADACGCKVVVPDFGQLAVGGVNDQGIRSFEYAGTTFTTRLLGSYQPSNATLAIEAARALAARGWNVTEEDIVRGIDQATWPARFEVLDTKPGQPALVVDGGHNPQGAAVLAESLRDVFAGRRIVIVMSVLADKDYRNMIREVAPLAVAFVCATPPVPRRLLAVDLAKAIREECGEDMPVQVAEDFPDAFARACEIAGPDGVVCAFGSLYSVSCIKAALA